jgi:O-antigen ligase
MVSLRFQNLARHWNTTAFAVVFFVVSVFLFGGASQLNQLRLMVVELAALPLLVLAAGRFADGAFLERHGFLLGLLAATLALPLLQILPLPPGLWSSLPGREPLTQALSLAGTAPGWTALSMTPELTWRAFLALIPPTAILLFALGADARRRDGLVILFVLGALASLGLGFIQMLSGSGRLYLWTDQGTRTVAGFFANRNHLATLCLVSLPFAATLITTAVRRGEPFRRPRFWLGLVFVPIGLIGLAAIQSRAGIVLILPVLVATLAAAWIADGRRKPNRAVTVVAALIGLLLLIIAVIAAPPLIARFTEAGSYDARLLAWGIVGEAAGTYLPVGSGIGSFDAIYRSVEPLATLDPLFFNHAHNEFLEMWLETGWPGAGLFIAFLIWFGRRSVQVWRASASDSGDLQRAASIALLAMVLHSGVDYPLRTETMAVLFALCCAILEFAGQGVPADDPPVRKRRRTRVRTGRTRDGRSPEDRSRPARLGA